MNILIACEESQASEPEDKKPAFSADDNDAHVHDYSPWGICSICGEIKYKSPAYCELHGCDPD